MVFILSLALFVSLVGIAVIASLYMRAGQTLERYSKIQDAEEYTADCERKAALALAEHQRLDSEKSNSEASVAKLKQQVSQYSSVVGKFRTVAELDHTITQRSQELKAISETIGQARSASEIAAQVQYYENFLSQLKADVATVEEARDLQEFGYYEPRFDFESSDMYKDRLDEIKRRQKEMLKSKTACTCNTEWTVEGSKQQGRKMVNEQIKLMLRAFNGECDAAIGKVKYNNAVTLGNRLGKSFEQISKLGATKQIHLSPEYLNAKLEELYLSHEYQMKKQDEREEQARIREIIREEEKVAKEIEQAKNEAEWEEHTKERALEVARKELAELEGQNTLKMQALVEKLETELKEAIDRKAKAIARAQLTRSGHVYVLSNIGTFGEGVYKIGLTRRLEPQERVNELGGASVPFPFDVHAMIYTEDAPALENSLHKHFASRRVNLINHRREFFRVGLDDIRTAVASLHGQVTFVLQPAAEQYRQTLAMRRKQTQYEQRSTAAAS